MDVFFGFEAKVETNFNTKKRQSSVGTLIRSVNLFFFFGIFFFSQEII